MKIAICSYSFHKRHQTLPALKSMFSDDEVVIYEFDDIKSFIMCLLHDIPSPDIAFLDAEMRYIQGVDLREYIQSKGIGTKILFARDIPAIRSACPDAFVAHWGPKTYPLEYNRILYVEACNHHLKIYTKDRFYNCRGSLQLVQEELYQAGFVKTHQGYLVNMQHILTLEPSEVILSNGERIPVSRTQKKHAREKLYEYFDRPHQKATDSEQ